MVARRVREQLMQCSPEKKTEGLFAGLSKWSKDKADSRLGPGSGPAGGKGNQVSLPDRIVAAGRFTPRQAAPSIVALSRCSESTPR